MNEVNKSRGSEMHWVGGGLKSTKGQFPPFYVKTYLCVVFLVFFFYRFMIVDYCILKISLLYLLFFSRFKADSWCYITIRCLQLFYFNKVFWNWNWKVFGLWNMFREVLYTLIPNYCFRMLDSTSTTVHETILSLRDEDDITSTFRILHFFA